jgi:putative colanic acid biosynthesis UDP-glucose lipid carrier transferase
MFTLSLNKFIVRKYFNYLRRKGRNLRTILIVGAGEVGQNFYNSIRTNPHFGYKLVGFLDDNIKVLLNGKYLGKIDQLEHVLNTKPVNDVIIALPNYATEKLDWVISVCENSTAKVRIIPDYFKYLSERFEVTIFDKFPLITVRTDKINEFSWRMLKRGFDFVFAFYLFVLIFSWLFPLIAIGIKLTSKGPIFFKHERWGRNNRRFITYKFRSMVMESEEVDATGKYKQATKNDERITKFGAFLRKTNFDELPQFWNVLMSDMSVVGPRPHPTPLNLESKDKIRYYQLRHLVKPGVTGWAQINGYRGETKEHWKMQKRVEHDLWYIEHWSFLLDLQIITLTIWNMIKGDENAY